LANVSITSGDYIEFAGARLDLGSYRLSGDREYGDELALCRNYYKTLPTCAFSGVVVSSTTVYLGSHFEPMRAAPTVTLLDSTPTILVPSQVTGSSATIGGASIAIDGIRISLTGFTGLTANNGVCGEENAPLIALNAEL
jgi:hypothetical protein